MSCLFFASTNLHAVFRPDSTLEEFENLSKVIDKKEYAQLAVLMEGFNFRTPVRPSGSSVLVLGVESNDVKIVRIMLDAGASPDSIGGNGQPPLIAATIYNTANPEIVKLLLDRGANRNITYNFMGERLTPLEWAIKRGHQEIAEILRSYRN